MKNAKSHCAGLFFMWQHGIQGTCGAAISTGRFMDVGTKPVLRGVQLKADATLVNGVCICVWYAYRWKGEGAYDGNQCK